VLIMGDAAHATTPHMGQGAAQAVEDAVVLGQLFSQNLPMDQLLAAFMQRRYDRCKFIFESSLQIGEWEQHPTPDADPAALTKKMLATVAQPI
jgi:2-polyprenyl-6-methoxyphenol hydroxylase-like FAD-dependent oxidoreductase